ncbi:MAG TPA: hypothetical protein VLK85_19310 [Ramlibacter sp.]|nr:hypothetical protein [Ramlibacter sp.]
MAANPVKGYRAGPWAARLAGSLGLVFAAPASAHVFAQSYALPIPFWMYATGAASALLLSFVAIGVLAAAPRWSGVAVRPQAQDAREGDSHRFCAAGAVALGLLALCIASGLAGAANAYQNFNMTFFWIVFVLAVPYLAAVAGDFYAPMNPWQALVACLERLGGRAFNGRLQEPARWGHWPAVALYAAFIHVELFAHLQPRGLSLLLLAYSLLNVAGAWVFGRASWFRQGEFFGVMLRVLGSMAPLEWRPEGWRWRPPFAGLLRESPRDMGLVVFVLFMLSSTAFDGLHGTLPWANFYWSSLNPVLTGGLGLSPRELNALSAQLYSAWQRGVLVVSPFAYLVVFAAVIAAMKVALRPNLGWRELLFRFTFSLVPIAFVYHVTHYFTLLLAQGGQILSLVSDPLGLGWNLFGTGQWKIEPLMLDMGTLWHTQVALIVAGHVASVWVAHLQALALSGCPRRAAASQLPMLVLMMGFTAFGLWILSLPLGTTGG